MKKIVFSIISLLAITVAISLTSCQGESIKSTKNKDVTNLFMATVTEMDDDINIYALTLVSDGATMYAPQEGDELFGILFFSEDNDENFPLNGKYSCSGLDFLTNDPFGINDPAKLKMQFAGVKGDLGSMMGDMADSTGNYITSGSAYIDGDATNATVILEVTFNDNSSKNFYYEGPIKFLSEDDFE